MNKRIKSYNHDVEATENELTNAVDGTRRSALLGLASGATALSVWHKPVINAVVTPAHAQTTEMEEEMEEDALGIDPGTTFIFLSDDLLQNGDLPAKTEPNLLDMFINTAHAGIVENSEGPIRVIRDIDFKVTYGGDGNFDIEILFDGGSLKYSENITLGEVTEIEAAELESCFEDFKWPMTSVEITAASTAAVELTLRQSDGNDPYTLLPGDATLELDCFVNNSNGFDEV